MEVNDKQWQAFANTAESQFRGRVREFLRSHLPAHTAALANVELDGRIVRFQARASSYGVVSERGIAKWAFLSIVLGEEFDQVPEIHQFLNQTGLNPAAKVDLLMETLEVRLRMSREKES